MHPLPHFYRVTARGGESALEVGSNGLDTLKIAAPAEFDGPGNLWSPETLLAAAVGSCFILSFRAVARASRLQWLNLDCEVEGKLDRTGAALRFTDFLLRVRLIVPKGTDLEKSRRLLEKAENSCIITNSLSGARHVEAQVAEG